MKTKLVEKVTNRDIITTDKLTPRQERFCRLYFSSGEFFGNGVWSYIVAYDYDIPLIGLSSLNTAQKKAYSVARSGAYDILTKPYIIKEGKKILDSLIESEVVDRELVKVILQNKDLSSKVSAIREFNKLKGRIQNKLDLTSKKEQVQTVVNIVKYYDIENDLVIPRYETDPITVANIIKEETSGEEKEEYIPH